VAENKSIRSNPQLQRLYYIWSAMKGRCYNKNDKGFQNYGGRGILVDEAWHNFYSFYNDMGFPQKGQTLERVDNNKSYSKENCTWADRNTQAANRRFCNYVKDGDETVCLKEYCRRHGLKYRPTAKRVTRGWSINDAVSIPLGLGKRAIRLIKTNQRGNQ